MNWTSLIVGLLIGWIAEWVIDWLYWRRRAGGGSADLDNLRAQNNRLRADLEASGSSVAQLKADLTKQNANFATAQADNDKLRAELAAANGSLGQLRAELESNSAGHESASAELARLRARVNVDRGAAAALNDQISRMEADLSAAQAESAQLRAQLAGSTPAAAGEASQFKTQLLRADDLAAGLELEQLRAENAQLRAQASAPAAAGPGDGGNQYRTQLMSVADLNLGGAITADETARLRADLDGANSELANLRAELARLRGQPARDPLIDINGIGPVIEKRLFEAGIYTFEQLAAEDPERLRQLARLKEWQEADPAAWVAEARERAAHKDRS